MTAGTRTMDGRFQVESFCATAPTNKAGPYYSKTWSGADRIKDPVVYDLLWHPEKKRYYKKRRVIRRKDEPHNYSMSLRRTSEAQYRVQHYKKLSGKCVTDVRQWWTEICITRPSEASFGATPWTNNHDWDLLGKLHEKLYGSQFDPGIFLAELPKALEMIGGSARRIARAAYYARKGNVREVWTSFGTTTPSGRRIRVPKNTSMSANHWAEYRWGWGPLYQDMHDGAVWLAHSLYAPVTFRYAVRRVAKKDLPYGWYNVWGIQTSTNEWRVRKQLVAYLTEQPKISVLESINPASIAWELVPFSFVVDWALPIGRYLQLRGMPSKLSGTFVTTTSSVIRTADPRGFTPSGSGFCAPQIVARYFGTGERIEMNVSRVVSTSLAIPDIEFRGFEKVATWKHAVDALALMTQRLKRLQVD